MSRERGGFGGNTLHQIAVGDDAIDVRLNDLMPRLVELRRKMRGSHCHPHTLPEPLPERTRCGLHARRQSILRMSRRLAVELAEVLDLLHWEVISRQVQQRIQQHRAMPAGKNEAVASRPFWVAWVVAQMTRPQGKRHSSAAHRKPRVTGVGLLYGIRCKKADRINRTSLKIVCHIVPVQMR